MVLGHHLRTAERKQDATGLNHLERLLVESRITLQGIMQRPTMLGEGWWVEDDEVIAGEGCARPFVACFRRGARIVTGEWRIVQKLKGILAESLMALVAREVQFDVAVGQFDGLGTGVDGVNQRCPTPHGIKREATRVAEHIEHTAAVSIMF